MIDGVLYVKVVDAKQASYGVENAMCVLRLCLRALAQSEQPRPVCQLPAARRYAVVQLAQTTMRSELGAVYLAAELAPAPARC